VQVNAAPADMETAGSCRPRTGIGSCSSRVPPLPSCPPSFRPQHHVLPASDHAQLCTQPAVTPATGGRARTRRGLRRSMDEPSPTAPHSFLPQHHTSPVRRNAHVCQAPATTLMASEISRTRPGASGSPDRPSCPYVGSPQQSTSPLARRAHVCRAPAARATIGPGDDPTPASGCECLPPSGPDPERDPSRQPCTRSASRDRALPASVPSPAVSRSQRSSNRSVFAPHATMPSASTTMIHEWYAPCDAGRPPSPSRYQATSSQRLQRAPRGCEIPWLNGRKRTPGERGGSGDAPRRLRGAATRCRSRSRWPSTTTSTTSHSPPGHLARAGRGGGARARADRRARPRRS